MKKMQRISLAVLISSALTGGVFANGTAELVMDPADTWAPEKAAVNKMAVRLAESVEAKDSENSGIDLSAIGKSYTADTLEPLEPKDFTIGSLSLGANFKTLTTADRNWEALVGGPLQSDSLVESETKTAKLATDEAEATTTEKTEKTEKTDAKEASDKETVTKDTAAKDAVPDTDKAPETKDAVNKDSAGKDHAVKDDSHSTSAEVKSEETGASQDKEAVKGEASKGDGAVKGEEGIKLLIEDKKPRKIRPAKPAVLPIAVSNMFTTYTGKDGSFTIYTGVYGDQGSALTGQHADGDTLRREGLDYTYAPQTITNIHITGGTDETDRGIGIGKTRGTVLFAYGAPQGMWRDVKNGTVALIYKYEKTKNSVKNKQEFNTPVAKDNKESTLLTTNSNSASASQYLVFTLKNNKVSAIDMIDGEVWSRLRLPAVQEQYYRANHLTADDFSLMGYRVNEPFVSNQDEQWQQRGFLYDDEFIAYDDILVGYDKKQMVARAMITKSTALTRRGISIGDSKYLLLYLYGMPTSMEADTAANGDPLMVYTYKNPDSAYSYLLFTVGEKDNFIKTVMLSDRPNKELSK